MKDNTHFVHSVIMAYTEPENEFKRFVMLLFYDQANANSL